MQMRSLFKQFVDSEISRRDFTLGLAALGFSAAAVDSMAAALGGIEHPVPAAGVSFKGTGAEIFVETLRAAGIRNVFGTTATGMSPFFDALTVRPDIRMILSIAESQATSMAHGFELASLKTAALFVPGVAVPSTLNNLYNAWKDRSAIAVFADGPGAGFPGRNGFEQMDDWLAPAGEFTKWTWQVDKESQISEMTRRAIKVAQTPPGGPVHIRFPNEILAARNVEQIIYPQARFSVSAEMRPKPELIEAAARALIEAKRPVLCAGGEVTRAGANAGFLELAELLGASFTQGMSVYGDVPLRHPLFGGFYGLGFPRVAGGQDVFLNIGAPMPDPAYITPPVPRTTRVIQARVELEAIAMSQPVDIAIAAGVKETVTALIDAIRGMATPERLKQISQPRLAAAREAAAKEEAKRLADAKEYWNASPMSWERVSAEIEEVLEEDAIVVPELDYRTPYSWLDFSPGRKRLIGQTTGFALGWGVGAALGVKTALPDREVVCLVGDGAFLFGQIESLWSAARYEIPVLIVILNNRSYDNERNRIEAGSPLWRNQETRAQWRDISGYLGRPAVDFAGLAKSFEIEGATCTKPEELRKALRRAKRVMAEGRPFLIDAVIMQLDRSLKRTEQTWYPKISVAAERARKV
jgi:benzoylformate decarboxylase